jgi:hypothetical protein
MPAVGGVVHTHSTYATAWAARGEPVPCVLTAMADEFGGEIPVGPFALIGGDEIGRGIVATLDGHRSPAVLMRSHGVFTIGGTPVDAVKAAVMCEDAARTVHIARALGAPEPLARTRWTRSTSDTKITTASADQSRAAVARTHPFRKVLLMTDRKPRIGILGIMQDLYDDMIPGIAQRQAGYAAEIAAQLADVGEFIPSKPVKYREDAEREMRAFEARISTASSS